MTTPSVSPRGVVAFVCASVAAFASPPHPAWRDASMSLFKNAHAGFVAVSKDTGDADAEARLGRALTFLVLQPKTTGNIDRAEELLRSLADDPSSVALAPAALYYLGRIAQVHRSTPDPDAARAHYRRLRTTYPDTDYAALAAVKLAIIDLYEPVPPETRRARFDALALEAAALRPAFARRDLSLLLADVAQQFGYGDALALEHLLRADQAGITRPAEQADTWVRIAETASRTGRPDIAREHYAKHLAAFARDNRRQMIEERLAALPPARP